MTCLGIEAWMEETMYLWLWKNWDTKELMLLNRFWKDRDGKELEEQVIKLSVSHKEWQEHEDDNDS